MSSFLGFFVGVWQTVLAVLGFAPDALSVTSFEECIDAGYSVHMTASLPGTVIDCTTPDGEVFPNPDYRAKAEELITPATQATSPSTGELAASSTVGASPLTVTFTHPFSQDREAPFINFGDGSKTLPMSCSRTGCVLEHTYNVDHTGIIYAALITKDALGREHIIDTIEVTITSLTVPGMSIYSDADFGFSFWYPTGWIIDKKKIADGMTRSDDGAVMVGSVTVKHPTQWKGVSIAEYYSANRAFVTEKGACGPAADCPYFVRYYFDADLHTWMQYETYRYPGVDTVFRPDTTVVANVSSNTMGGLHVLGGYVRHGGAVIVPLSARNFLHISNTGETGDPAYRTLVNTVVATDPAVATPVGASEQVKVIQAAKDAYAR